MPRQYMIFDYRPAWCDGGGHKFGAYRTFDKPWEMIRDFLPPTVCNYALYTAANKPTAVKEAKRRWASRRGVK